MDIWILDHNFVNTYLIDEFTSIIWNESYIGYGDFELFAPINDYTLKITTFVREQRVKELDSYVWLKGSDQVMIVEAIELSTDIEVGPSLLFTGRSLESILERRIVWRQTILDSKFDYAIKRLINENVIDPPDDPQNGSGAAGNGAIRRIPNFVYKDSTDPRIQALTLSKQFTGTNLYEAIVEVCEPLDLGFRITLNAQNQFVFELYMGTDRTYDQLVVPYVIFSPKYENLIKSNWLEDIKEYRNVTLVAGEDEGHQRRTWVSGQQLISGLKRRELYTDARDIQSEFFDDDGNQQQVDEVEYFRSLNQRGLERLSEWKFIKTFESEVEATVMYEYGKDFFKGDIVQVETDYGIRAKMRIMQFVRTQEESGHSYYPVFKILE